MNAHDVAIKFEAVKSAYRQTKDGVVISLVIHPNDMSEEVATAPLGQRFAVALVPLTDAE
jgi:hypothetical protein